MLVDGNSNNGFIARDGVEANEVDGLDDMLSCRIGGCRQAFRNVEGPLFPKSMIGDTCNNGFLDKLDIRSGR